MMEGTTTVDDHINADPLHSSYSSNGTAQRPSASIEAQSVQLRRAIQYWLDKSTVHMLPRWLALVGLWILFFVRIYYVQGFFIVAYGLGIFLLNHFIAFLSPLEDPSAHNSSSFSKPSDDDDGLILPTTSNKEDKEYRPFARRLPEFKFWLSCTRGTLTALGMTLFSMFDIPVFWPILLLYFFALFFMTMKRQVAHMIQHKYVPVNWGGRGKSKYKNAGQERGMYGGGASTTTNNRR